MSKEPRPQSELYELQGEALGEPTPFCLPDETISMFFDGQASPQQRDVISRHLSGCRFCRGRIGLLSRLKESGDDTPVAEEFKAKAKQLGAGNAAKWWKRTSRWAAAAVVLLAAGMWIGQALEQAAPIAAPDMRDVRSVETPAVKPRILRPIENSVIDPENFRVEWTPVPGSLHYELYLLSAAGDLLIHERLNETRWAANEPLPPAPAGEYYVRIEAHLEDATTLSSEHVLLTVPDEEPQ